MLNQQQFGGDVFTTDDERLFAGRMPLPAQPWHQPSRGKQTDQGWYARHENGWETRIEYVPTDDEDTGDIWAVPEEGLERMRVRSAPVLDYEALGRVEDQPGDERMTPAELRAHMDEVSRRPGQPTAWEQTHGGGKFAGWIPPSRLRERTEPHPHKRNHLW